MYKWVRKILFLFDPESVHHFSMNCLKLLCKSSIIKKWLTRYFDTTNLLNEKNIFWGIEFKNIVGLGAGFDKNACYLTELETLGFGFIEIGTVTPKAQEGNPRPRLFRLSKDCALINKMGFNNEGAEAISKRLKEWRSKNKNTSLIIGGNIGKNKSTPNEDAWKDYEYCFETLFDNVDYFTVNVSSPNTTGLRELQQKEMLRQLFSVLQKRNQAKRNPKPLLLKVSPDLSEEQVNDIVSLA